MTSQQPGRWCRVEDRRLTAGSATPRAGARQGEDFRHLALLCRGADDFAATVAGFAREALIRGDAVLVAVPPGRAGRLRAELGEDAWRADFMDISEIGRNPGRIIPAVHSFAERHQGRRITCVGEPVWASRSPPELLETERHEALVNLAFTGMPVTAACVYDAGLLAPGVLAGAESTHPFLVRGQQTRASPAYLGPGGLPPECDAPLPAPPPAADLLHYRTDLRPVRALVARRAERAGLSADRVADLVIAVSELAANTLRHTEAGGTLRAWHGTGEILCDVCDQGWIAEPLAGRRRPAPGDAGGQGLWLVHQVCDLVEMRTGPDRTTIRLHMSLGG